MKKYLGQIRLVIIAFMSIASIAISVPSVSAAPVDEACKGLIEIDRSVRCDNAATKDGAFGLVADVINILSIVVGAAAVIVIIIGGIRYVVSGGDSAGVQGAKNTILYAIVGLVVALFAQVIVRFVLDNTKPTP